MWSVTGVKRAAKLLVIIFCTCRCSLSSLFRVFHKMWPHINRRSTGTTKSIFSGFGGFISKRPAFVGLINQGATCYLNTLLQTWFMTPEVKHYIASLETDVDFIHKLKSLFNKLESREVKSLETNELTTSLGLNVSKQCDIEECFRNLISKLKTEVDQEHNIVEFYQIIMVLSMKCSVCANLFEDDCFFLDVPLPIRLAYSSAKIRHLETALQEFLKEDTMEGDNEPYCDHCSTKTKTETRYYFKQLPQILTFQLKRFEAVDFWMYYQKFNECITIPLALEFHKSQDNCNEWCLKPTMDKENDTHNNDQSQDTGRGPIGFRPMALQKEDPGCTDSTVGDGELRRTVVAEDQSQQDATEEKENDTHNNDQSQDTGRGPIGFRPMALQKEDPGCTDSTVGDGELRRTVAAEDQSQQDATEEKEKKYELFAIWHHSGVYGSGHYYAEIKSVADGNWYYFNDTTVKKIKQVSVSSKTAYLIMYRRKDTNNTPGCPQLKTAVEGEENSHSKVLSGTDCCNDFENHPSVSGADTKDSILNINCGQVGGYENCRNAERVQKLGPTRRLLNSPQTQLCARGRPESGSPAGNESRWDDS
ncbi:ubiquitin carboxyl-terminal hydrolase 47-like isoform X2 [Heptranchias perlo]|uniref:ubiquitin carboxyl-terminal hydrolase 47-like isoform X2 n=1 Tax=Heptranchias perlo TaxID=212740 RepID=UPI00355956A8